MPILADVFERYQLVKELDADRLSTAKTSRRALAGAIYAVLGEPTPAGAIGLADFSAARVDRLFNPRAELPPITTRRRIVVSAAGATLLAVVLAFPIHLDVGESTHLRSMLATMSLHGLPGMAVGFLVDGLILSCITMGARRLLRGL